MNTGTRFAVAALFFLTSPVYASGADIDGDGQVTAADIQLMREAFFSDAPQADLDGSGRVDFADLAILRGAYEPVAAMTNPVKSARGTPMPTVSLLPDTQTVSAGETVLIEVWVDFSGEATLGGGFDIAYDESLLDYGGFEFDPDYSGDPDFSRAPDELPGGVLEGLAIGNFFEGITGPERVGTLSFEAIAPGSIDLSMSDNVIPAGPFISFVTSLVQDIDYVGATVVIQGSVQVSPTAVNFGHVLMPAEETVTIANQDTTVVSVGQIGIDDPLEPPFSILQDDCSMLALQPDDDCQITLGFDSNITEEFDDSFDIPLTGAAVPSVTVSVGGSSTQTVAVDILPGECPNSLLLDEPAFIPVVIVGTAELNVNSIDAASIRLNNAPPRRSFVTDLATPFLPLIGKEDINDCNDFGPDGFNDMLLLFDYRALRDTLTDTQTYDIAVLQLTGDHLVVYPVANEGSWPFVGEDIVLIQRED